MANKNFTQFGLSSFAGNADYLVGYSKDGNQELRYTAGSLLTGGNYDFIINGVPVGRGKRSSFNNNSVLGYQAYDNATIFGENNVAIGVGSLRFNITGDANAALGAYALYNNVTSKENTAVGFQALYALSANGFPAEGGNTAVGRNALTNLVHKGSLNTAVGYYAMNNTTGHGPGGNIAAYNTAIGASSLQSVLTGLYNSAVGYNCFSSLLSGDWNVGIGVFAGSFVTRSIRNTFVGSYAGLAANDYKDVACLGYAAQVTGSNEVQLGGVGTTPYAYAALQIRSDIRDKADVRDTALGLDFIMALRPVDYKWDLRDSYMTLPPVAPSCEATEEEKENYKLQLEQWTQANDINNLVHDGTHKRTRYHHGLIAQEVKQVIDDKGIDFGGYQDHTIQGGKDVQSIGYGELVAPLIKAIQELKQEFDAYKASHP